MQLKSSSMSLLLISLFISVGAVSGTIQTFKSDIGTVSIDLPYDVEPGEFSSGDSLSLVKPGTTKPIINININDAALYSGFQSFAESFIGTGHTFEEKVTNDGKPMLFNVYQEGSDQDGNPNYTFRGYVDYSTEKGKYIIIHAPNKVRYHGDVIARYSKEQFAAICQSLTIK